MAGRLGYTIGVLDLPRYAVSYLDMGRRWLAYLVVFLKVYRACGMIPSTDKGSLSEATAEGTLLSNVCDGEGWFFVFHSRGGASTPRGEEVLV